MSTRITDVFPAAVAHLRSSDPVLAGIIDLVGSPSLALRESGFAALIFSIVSQQISVKAAAAIRDRLIARLAGQLTPAAVLELGPDDLRAVGLSRAKSAYLLDLAAKVACGAVEIDRFVDLDDETIITELVRVKGIGRWTAEMYLIFALGRPDVLPVDDLGLRAGLRRWYGLESLPDGVESRRIAEPWRPYRSLGTWYLWRAGAAVPAAAATAPTTPA